MRAAKNLSPPHDFVRYLAIFHRFFSEFARRGAHCDPAWYRLSGRLTNAVHNVPALLWHSGSGVHSPAEMRRWLERGFLATLLRKADDDDDDGDRESEYVDVLREILRSHDDENLLGLKGGLASIRFPPDEKLRGCLSCLYEACILLRLLIHVRERGFAPLARCVELAEVLAPIPAAIVDWPSFPEKAAVMSFYARLKALGFDEVMNNSSVDV